MEYFTKLAQHSAQRYRALALPLRVACGLLLVVALTGALLLGSGWRTGPYQPLFEGRAFSLRELARMTTAFQAAGLRDARLVEGRILVPRARLDAYLAALDVGDALPADFDDSLDQAAADNNPFMSRQQTELGHRIAEQKKLARILSGMSGIETASVQFAQVKKPGFPPAWDVRAVAAVRAVGNRELSYEEIEAVRDTVAGFVAGLERAQVTIADLNACRAYPGGDDPGTAAGAYAARTEQARLEQTFAAKIRDRLTAYPGAIVGVQVQLASSPTAEDGDRAVSSPRFVPALVSASIDLPRSVVRRAWRGPYASGRWPVDRQTIQTVENDLQQTVEQAVLALLPPPMIDLQGRPQVVVTTYEDPPAQTETAWTRVTSLITGWTTRFGAWRIGAVLCVVGLSIIGTLLVLRRRSASSAPVAATEARDPLADDGPATIAFNVPLARTPSVEREVRVEVQQAICDDPQAAAEALQRWLGKVA